MSETKLTFKQKLASYKLYGMPWYYFAIFALVILVVTYVPIGLKGEDFMVKSNLPAGMLGMFGLMIVLGTIFNEIGEKTPIIRSYLGGGAIVTIFATSALVYFKLLPSDIVSTSINEATGAVSVAGTMRNFFATGGGFLDWYIAALITGSILGMNRKLLAKASARFFPAILGGVVVSLLLTWLVGAIIGYGGIKAMLLIGLPIIGGGMGAGAVPMSQIFESFDYQGALNVMVPAVAIGNTLSIVFSGLLPKLFKGENWNGQGALMKVSGDPREYELTPEELAERDKIDIKNLGIGILVSASFFCFGIIINKLMLLIDPNKTFLGNIHAYAWMIIAVAVCKITRALPSKLEIACHQWFQFMSKNLTPMLLVGIGAVYVTLGDVINAFSLQYLLLCLVTVVGAIIGAGAVSYLVGFYPVEGAITSGLCMSNMGGTGDVACLSAADRMELMPFAQISSRIGGAFILLLATLLLSLLAGFIV
ncbi:MAG: 2-hydroxycarboxylate transporter family protein [Acholeplasmataceae bacterium]|jgi:Na+/citrate or Na+/malate symporter|nr:2-hydroxycarboxylate transporter family protein [Acholeplasmataceae bacterium]